jgi:hypothetical protein
MMPNGNQESINHLSAHKNDAYTPEAMIPAMAFS